MKSIMIGGSAIGSYVGRDTNSGDAYGIHKGPVMCRESTSTSMV